MCSKNWEIMQNRGQLLSQNQLNKRRNLQEGQQAQSLLYLRSNLTKIKEESSCQISEFTITIRKSHLIAISRARKNKSEPKTSFWTISKQIIQEKIYRLLKQYQTICQTLYQNQTFPLFNTSLPSNSIYSSQQASNLIYLAQNALLSDFQIKHLLNIVEQHPQISCCFMDIWPHINQPYLDELVVCFYQLVIFLEQTQEKMKIGVQANDWRQVQEVIEDLYCEYKISDFSYKEICPQIRNHFKKFIKQFFECLVQLDSWEEEEWGQENKDQDQKMDIKTRSSELENLEEIGSPFGLDCTVEHSWRFQMEEQFQYSPF